MKYLLLLVVFFSLCSCGVKTNSAIASSALESEGLTCQISDSLVGSWTNTSNGEVLTLTSDCYLGTDTCHVVGAATTAVSTAGNIIFVIKSVDDRSTCIDEGTHECTYQLDTNNDQLSVVCSGQTYVYSK